MPDIALPNSFVDTNIQNVYVPIHVHSQYSLLDGYSDAQELAKKAKELGLPAIALTDHGSMAGLTEFYECCLKEGVKPILGMEAYTVPMGHSRFERERYDIKELRGKPGHVRNNNHLLLLCKDYEVGYKNLCSLHSAAYADGYYYKPRIDFELLKEHHEGLICSSACILGEVAHNLWCDDYDKAREVAMAYQDLFGEDYYIEIMNHWLPMEMKVMQPLRDLAKELGIKTIVTNDSHFTNKEDHKLQKTMMLWGMHKSWADDDVTGSFYDNDDKVQETGINGDDGESDPIFDMPPELYIKTFDEMVKANRINGGENGIVEQELATTIEIANKCNCILPFIDQTDMTQYHVPHYDFENDLQYDEYVNSGFKLRESTRKAVFDEMKKLGREGETLEEVLTEYEFKTLDFLMWMCEKGIDERVRPKIQMRGEPLPIEYWCDNPPEHFKINHKHNSPDERWIKEQLAKGNTEDDIIEMYHSRVDYEISIIMVKLFAPYFLLVQAYVNYTKLSGSYVGPGRGSGAGSLLNYLIGITSIDPLPNGLLFFRFINVSRASYPDIDCDFAKDFRDDVLKPYLRNRFGEDCAAAVSTYMYAWGKAAIRGAARVLFNPPDSIQIAEDLCDLLDDKPKLDLNMELVEGANPAFVAAMNSSKKHRQVVDLALKIQGHVIGESIHASAFILSPEPITDKLPLTVSKDERKRAQDTGEPIREYQIAYSGEQTQSNWGYVKLDLLCLKDLEMIDLVQHMIQRVYGCKLHMENLPFDDGDVYQLLLDGYNSGIFQFDGSPVALRILQASGADSLSDWSAINAMNRPGPLQLGYDQDFINGRKHPEAVTYFTPVAEQYLKETYGTVTYQEQLMQLSQEPSIVGFDGGQADHLRKVTAKKKKDQIEEMKEEARDVAAKNGADPKITEYFLEVAEAAGSYSFNKSHSVAYAVIAYWDAFLKTHFPECFLAAMCTLKPQMKKVNKIPMYLDEARQLGVTVKPPHVNYSMENFDVPEKGVIAFGLGGIKRVGKGAAPIIAEREANGPFADFTDFCTRVPREVGKAPLEALVKAGALDGLGWSRMAMEESIDQIVEFRKNYFMEKEKKELFEDDLFGGPSADEPAEPPIRLVAPFDTEYTERELMRKEKEQFGMYFARDPRDYYRVSRFMEERSIEQAAKAARKAGDYSQPAFVNIGDVASLPDKTPVEFVANVEDTKAFRTKKGSLMGNVLVWDNGVGEESRFGFSPVKKKLKCTVFSRVWEQISPPLPDEVVHVRGRVSVDPEGRWPTAVLVDSISSLPPDSEWTGASAPMEKTMAYAQARSEMEARDAELADPASKRYLIPALLFANETDLDAFLLDPDIDRFRGDGRVQVSVAGDETGARTEIVNLKQTRGMVAFAARYGAVAKKIRLPKAQRAMERMAMMGGAVPAVDAEG